MRKQKWISTAAAVCFGAAAALQASKGDAWSAAAMGFCAGGQMVVAFFRWKAKEI